MPVVPFIRALMNRTIREIVAPLDRRAGIVMYISPSNPLGHGPARHVERPRSSNPNCVARRHGAGQRVSPARRSTMVVADNIVQASESHRNHGVKSFAP
jgi:hypothetical protein